MNVEPDDGVREEARLWAIRLRDPAFAGWDAFTAWLEADPAHNDAYEAALDEMNDSDALFDAPARPAWTPQDVPAGRRVRRWRAPAVAAGVAEVVLVYRAMNERSWYRFGLAGGTAPSALYKSTHYGW